MTVAADATEYTMGIEFDVTAAGCTLTAIWFYSATGAVELPDHIALFAVTGQSLIASQPAAWSGAAGSGWVRAAWTVPPALAASTRYKACVQQGTDTVNWYSATSHFWDTGAGQNGIISGPVSAPNNAGAAQGQDTFTASGALSYPATEVNAANYWVDVEVSVAGGSANLLMPPFYSFGIPVFPGPGPRPGFAPFGGG